MDPLSKDGDGWPGTENASATCSTAHLSAISKNSGGAMDRKGAGRLGGSLMSNAARWLAEAKSYEITGVSILFSAVLVASILSLFIGIRWDRSRNDRFYMNGKSYVMIGLAQIPGEKSNVYVPVYKETP